MCGERCLGPSLTIGSEGTRACVSTAVEEVTDSGGGVSACVSKAVDVGTNGGAGVSARVTPINQPKCIFQII